MSNSVEAMKQVELVVLLLLNPVDCIDVPEDEDPALRRAMDEVLLKFADALGLIGETEVIELTGPPDTRLARLEQVVKTIKSEMPSIRTGPN